MDKFVKEYKGFKIYKCKQDLYMKERNLHYLAYFQDGNVLDGATTLRDMEKAIDDWYINKPFCKW